MALARDLLRALAAAHAAGIVHSDVKPGNVLLAADGTALLADFGIAVRFDDPRVTRTGTFIGSPGYVAPERVISQDAGAIGDLFSLGATLYEAVEGVPAFRADIIGSVVAGQPAPMRRGGRLTALITRLLDKDPATRPDVAAALALVGDWTPPPTDRDARVGAAAAGAGRAARRGVGRALRVRQRAAAQRRHRGQPGRADVQRAGGAGEHPDRDRRRSERVPGGRRPRGARGRLGQHRGLRARVPDACRRGRRGAACRPQLRRPSPRRSPAPTARRPWSSSPTARGRWPSRGGWRASRPRCAPGSTGCPTARGSR